jgi:hypothetical protein
MTLTCSIKGSKEKKVVRVPLDPPLSGYEEVKPRLLGMKAEAQEGLGMVCLQFSIVFLSSLHLHIRR